MSTATIGAGMWLEAGAAASYARMRAAGMPAGVTSAGRTAAEQQHLRDLYLAGQGSYALPPAESRHVAGLALDLPGHIADPSTPRGWIRAHGFEHGWSPVANEPWHHEYTPTLDNRQEDPMTPELAARLAEIVEWQRTQFAYQNRRLDEVVTWMDRKFAGLDSTTPEAAGADATADAILAKLKAKL